MKDKISFGSWSPKTDALIMEERLGEERLVFAAKPVGRWDFYGLIWDEPRKNPNFFHRIMAKIFFGINYTKLK